MKIRELLENLPSLPGTLNIPTNPNPVKGPGSTEHDKIAGTSVDPVVSANVASPTNTTQVNSPAPSTTINTNSNQKTAPGTVVQLPAGNANQMNQFQIKKHNPDGSVTVSNKQNPGQPDLTYLANDWNNLMAGQQK